MKRILFQGDSITDAGRLRSEEEDGINLGFGYPSYAAAMLGCEFPGEFEFFNKGISGNKITDIYARMKRDIISLKPDYLSIMIGVNDVWHKSFGEDDVCIERFEQLYRFLIEDVKKELPNIKIMLICPFCDSITKGFFDGFNDEILKRAALVKKLAEEYSLAFMDSQRVIDDAQKVFPIEYWTADGVHPTIFGHKMLADEWVKVFKTIKN